MSAPEAATRDGAGRDGAAPGGTGGQGTGAALAAAAARRRARWPRWLRRGPLENLCTVLILLGTLMLTQPLALPLFGWSFLVILAGTVGFLIVSHFPD
ncbi:MAG: hypothetical protein RID91_19415 [Azospirillaceae bacterium]